jgi:hypothetical protein
MLLGITRSKKESSKKPLAMLEVVLLPRIRFPSKAK